MSADTGLVAGTAAERGASAADSTADATAAAAERTAAAFAAAGFPKMPARALLALVSSEQGSLTAAELSERLGASAAAVSGAVRYLQTVGFVHRISQPGSRRDLYALHRDEWYVVSMRTSPLYEKLAALTDATAGTLPEGSAARARVADMARFYRFLNSRMPALLDDWEREREAEP
ncbi:GbsR/MarR family transcriptional regulator [Pseudarthrobacter sp. C4D7]|uniref:GbsR/MarR family transcriptional regulator n=1 Tax=Pseudarthrobacter sp. C4D7 TaxID=2735268 RepID=UPI001584B383|nr:MarR family transcriptional regulator [Pseudarthrobacter sp. C4D7]NUT69628.1 MarR family transcriptional regulator [Pseudarthrobacter sp. C4D7]